MRNKRKNVFVEGRVIAKNFMGPFEYDDRSALGFDRVLCSTIMLPGFTLFHEDSATCWCCPYFEIDEDGTGGNLIHSVVDN